MAGQLQPGTNNKISAKIQQTAKNTWHWIDHQNHNGKSQNNLGRTLLFVEKFNASVGALWRVA